VDAWEVRKCTAEGILFLENRRDPRVADLHMILAGGFLLPHGPLHHAPYAQRLHHLGVGIRGQGVHMVAEKIFEPGHAASLTFATQASRMLLPTGSWIMAYSKCSKVSIHGGGGGPRGTRW
jgi:hypothetical protein